MIRHFHRRRRRWSLLAPGRYLLLLVVVYACAFRFSAQTTVADEYEIRAAMLFNLTKFIDWPASKMDTTHPDFYVCMLGSDPLGSDLDSVMQNKFVQGKPVIVRHLSSIDTADSCNILYVGSSERSNAIRASSQLAKNAVLTVSEKPNTDNHSQVIGLPADENHVRIEVNLAAAQQSGLTISSRLLRLATVTH